jgi:hypothetical protein
VPTHLRRQTAAAALVVVLAAALPYLPTIDDYYVQDDFGVVSLLAGKPWSTWPRWFYTTWMDDIWGYTPDEIRPFPALSYQLAALAGPAMPALNHGINIALHAANGLLVAWIARRAAMVSGPAAMFAAVLFVVLPVHAESVAWITGRVDSMPAFFYLAAFALYVAGASPRARIASLLLLFAALFSKQNTITFVPAIVLYDAIVGRRAIRLSWSWLWPYVPYAVLTAGYLLLRLAVFGHVAREETLTEARLAAFMTEASAHVRHVVFGSPDAFSRGGLVAFILAGALALAGPRRRSAIYFGMVWTALGIAPTLVAGYASPRHVYLAAVGWAVSLAVAADTLWQTRPRRLLGPAVAVAAAALVTFHTMRLVDVVGDWGSRAEVSRQAAADLAREAAAAPPGTLIIVGAPARSWGFALPFAARPPFASSDLTRDVTFVYHSSLHCCPANLWEPYTREALRAWLDRADRAPVIALYWNPQTGELSRVSDAEEPYLRSLVGVLLRTAGVPSLDEAIKDTAEEFVAPHRAGGR